MDEAHANVVKGAVTPNAALLAASMKIDKPKPTGAVPAPVGMVNGGEIARRLGRKYSAFLAMVQSGLKPAPQLTAENGNLYWTVADADAIVARHK